MLHHPVAEIFPLMTAGEFAALKQDISDNGLIELVWLYEGMILDGRNRWRACEELQLEPKTREYEGDTPVAFVLSLNLTRRHLTYDQKVGLAVRLRPMLKEEAERRMLIGKAPDPTAKSAEGSGESSQQAADALGVGNTAVKEMLAEAKEDPGVVEDLVQGKTTVKATRKKRRKRKNTERQKVAAKKVEAIEKPWTITEEQKVVPCRALITDPPYGILNESWEPKDLRTFTEGWARRWDACGADFLCVFWSQRYLWEGREWFDTFFPQYQFQQLLVWHYANNKSPQSRLGFKQTWEPIFFYRKKSSTQEVRISGAEWGDGLNDFDCHVAAVPQSNFNGQDMKEHPAQKPVSVFRWLIGTLTEPGDTVCDPFAGSGTCGVAAVQMKRLYHGVEIESAYRELAEGRIAAYGLTA